ncbi:MULTISPECIES: tRNA (adenosine(37)-N6)-threonylcarbamoyltransferase complex transferase subunit TsaD [Weeksella]|uniref:tRNA N6-adenosine threonylcarbamoyltransferase n=1 Tax=Weeksella virosa (strain ATCC 43766 / DSM 16922 / JCM 21250 / CCUG 30538 / CDC 9751 / IAM 14551 / NBRC 16016 / NCTC 11634 / CL345/78) TaxID=865938 RepID=F0NZZ4_WEEVC|nr:MULTISPECIES: tRNA (adenosine(37)-N6)-threonylcarbamoyltransferase complex transferase subunit TsaD [Weeksella]ADX68418.1 O-sialoglycoprotein endopeptidase [Weeksella virosa DSM 16922]MDK7674616.1 tRNA (adenosine(37)-N6)-threonylcarbamoyltransferase complex transferase subunit TsaD [Weeksella virosa]OFM84312.1 N(6)-L-threonylcarbamoyladenine synthase TsaD [Weeksella sp. HMSC059D05]SUP54750.1 t(6)A37 threonylcarbamoyladenosine biosynthesis protein [Weeksella virosa]VEH63927.1 t(6)A37 threony
MESNNLILGIESSCDDTGAAIILNNRILSNVVANQEIHQQYGGVVPELASRAHQQNIVPVIDLAIKKANIHLKDLKAIAYTRGPGLMGSLLVGSSFAKSMSLALNIPLIEVNHMQAHILAHFIEDANEQKPSFPFLCLTVSGGHTQIVKVNDYFDFELIGQTIDDAAGEAFDKAGKLLNLPYPAGPIIDKKAKLGDPHRFEFNKPKLANYNYSFSGLKTAILYFLQKETKKDPNFIEKNINDLCASIQYTIVNILMQKLEKASLDLGIKQIAIAGGVSANSGIREAFLANEKTLGWKVFLPKFAYTTDNAAMIAMVGQLKYERQLFGNITDKSTAKYSIE